MLRWSSSDHSHWNCHRFQCRDVLLPRSVKGSDKLPSAWFGGSDCELGNTTNTCATHAGWIILLDVCFCYSEELTEVSLTKVPRVAGGRVLWNTEGVGVADLKVDAEVFSLESLAFDAEVHDAINHSALGLGQLCHLGAPPAKKAVDRCDLEDCC